MASWISMDEACCLLGVRPQTVYAYVSRGKLEVMPDPADTRRSLYRAEDVAGLAKRKQAGRKHETLAANTLFGSEPSIPTALCAFFRGRPYYRGQDAVNLARSATLEEVAQLLWGAEQAVDFSSSASSMPMRSGKPGRVAAFTGLAALAADGHSTRGRLIRVLHNEGQCLVGQLAISFGAQPGCEPLHLRFAQGWKQSTQVADLLRTAMVLLVDHELTSSAFVARIAASTGASLPACLLAGLSTLSGPLHGDASGRVQALFSEVERLGEDQVVAHYLSTGLPLAGFGHHLYPDGDPRAAALLALFEPPEVIARFIQKVTTLTGLQPNIDVALAALVAHHRLPVDAAFGLFATARSIGLLAHSLEQLGVAQVIRPRGRYVGQAPDMTQAART
ncbi:citrate/2-methylcitrate synthase [Polaromonas naphthalenivorans]|uniref:citrate synthase (unknown stereospecificity) n=1 Tax=Polaromonas naphthalenivorans (strain CJ2) TaxID=365044 RepID=A1VKI4_POLNA|nr:citrate/2-methylcitrate synthase [Polaromonas naphthalenivorans]ABM36162.1 Citrate synthase [Polaromonas naphthalenivorans CJ2]